MKKMVYIETTVISYLTARPSRDLVVAAHQEITRQWWRDCRAKYEVVASQLVLQEAREGNKEVAQKRLDVLGDMELLEASRDALNLADSLVDKGILPREKWEDGLHIAIAATNGVDYLMTWNCTHIANASIRYQVEELCRAGGNEPVIICTPEELLEERG
jgi:predicted nucleic acid-binding protein